MEQSTHSSTPPGATTLFEKPKSLDLSHHLSPVAAARNTSIVKQFYKYFLIPNMRNLAGGLPFPGYFPFDTFESAIATPERFTESMNRQFMSLLSSDAKTGHMDIPKFAPPKTKPEKKIDIATALQYSTAQGYPPLYFFVKEFALEHQHRGLIPYDSPDIILTLGNTDGFAKAVQLVGDGARGDKLLVEEFTYMNALQCAKPLGIDVVPVGMDREGMRVSGEGGLKDTLENWDELRRGKRPSIMYTIPIGQNPTGGNASISRRKEIYALCQEYDIIIIEDDPYWYLQYNVEAAESTDFLASLIPSYVTIDIDGRVIRLDTFSKTIAPGCRLGWITANSLFVERLMRASETMTAAPSGFVQSLVAELLIDNWGQKGWQTWLSCLRDKYQERMEIMCEELRKGMTLSTVQEAVAELEYPTSSSRHRCSHRLETEKNGNDTAQRQLSKDYSFLTTVTKELYSFEVPSGGMFAWLHVNIQSHPNYDGTNAHKLMEQLWRFLASPEMLVLVAPGWMFSTTEELAWGKGCEYFRICYAAIEVEEVRRASNMFGVGIKKFWEEYPGDDDDDDNDE